MASNRAWFSLLFVGVAAFSGCGSNESNNADGNHAGTSSNGGHAGTSSAGSAGAGTRATGGTASMTGGFAGSGETTGGSAGASGSGGTTGSGGNAGSGGTTGGSAGNGGSADNAGSGGVSGGSAGNAGSGGTTGGTGGNDATGGSGGMGGSSNGGIGGSGGGTAGASGATGREAFYVATPAGNSVVMGSLDVADGVPRLLPGSPRHPDSYPMTLATDPSQKFLYVATGPAFQETEGHIDTYPIANDGTLAATPSSTIAMTGTPFSLTVDPKGRFAYVCNGHGSAIQAFTIDHANGTLTSVLAAILLHDDVWFVATDPSGNFLYATTGENGIHGYRIHQTTGVLTELDGSPFATNLPDGITVVGGGIVFKPSGGLMFTAGGTGMFSATGGALNAFKIDADSGALSLIPGSPFTTDLQSDPNAPNIAIDPQGKFVYVSNFNFNGHISGFAIQPDGALTPVPGPIPSVLAPYSLGVDASGRFVFVGGDAGDTFVFSIDRSNGRLTELDDSPFAFDGGDVPKFAFATLP